MKYLAHLTCRNSPILEMPHEKVKTIRCLEMCAGGCWRLSEYGGCHWTMYMLKVLDRKDKAMEGSVHSWFFMGWLSVISVQKATSSLGSVGEFPGIKLLSKESIWTRRGTCRGHCWYQLWMEHVKRKKRNSQTVMSLIEQSPRVPGTGLHKAKEVQMSQAAPYTEVGSQAT